MATIETVEELAEDIANKCGMLGSGGSRSEFIEDMKVRIATAVENTKYLEGI